MSTKIYNGLIINFPGSIADFRLELIRLAKEELLPQADIEFTKIFANIAFGKMDYDAWLTKRNPSHPQQTLRSLVMEAWESVTTRVHNIRATQHRDPVVDFEFSLTLFPIGDKLLAIPFSENRELMQILKSKPYVKDYGYWNNSDQPEGVSDKEWETRKNDWDKALPGIGIPSENGFTIHLIKEGYVARIDRDAIIDSRPSLEARSKELVEIAIGEIVDAKNKDNPAFRASFSSIMSGMSDWKKSEEGIRETERIKSEVIAFLNIQDALRQGEYSQRTAQKYKV